MLSAYDRELLHSNVGQAVHWLYVNNNGEINIENVERRIRDMGFLTLTEEMRLVLPTLLHEWVEHFERKREEYICKSKTINWLNDSSYDLWDGK